MLDLMAQKLAASVRRGERPSIDPSVVKLYVAESRRRIGALAEDLLGPAGTAVAHEASEWAMEMLHTRFPVSIGGGTDEVHHNNLSERALDLPRDVRVDKDIPWRDVPRG
jgi:alkylation response protein AidB-like acyl-CoA dehydrogenase